MRDKPVVYPIRLDDEPQAIARKVRGEGPVMTIGAYIWVERTWGQENWIKGRIIDKAVSEFSVQTRDNRS